MYVSTGRFECSRAAISSLHDVLTSGTGSPSTIEGRRQPHGPPTPHCPTSRRCVDGMDQKLAAGSTRMILNQSLYFLSKRNRVVVGCRILAEHANCRRNVSNAGERRCTFEMHVIGVHPAGNSRRHPFANSLSQRPRRARARICLVRSETPIQTSCSMCLRKLANVHEGKEIRLRPRLDIWISTSARKLNGRRSQRASFVLLPFTA